MSAPRRTEQDMLTEVSDLLSAGVSVEDVRGYGTPGTVEYVLGCARALVRKIRQQETTLGSALSKMPSALETAEFVRLAIRDNEAVTHAVRGAVMLRQMQLRGDRRTSDLAFGLYLEGR